VISVLLISITFYTYLAHIVFLCDLAFKRTVRVFSERIGIVYCI